MLHNTDDAVAPGGEELGGARTALTEVARHGAPGVGAHLPERDDADLRPERDDADLRAGRRAPLYFLDLFPARGEGVSAPGGEGPGAGGDERGGGGRGRGGRGAGIPPAKREIRRALVERFLAHSTRVTRSRDELRAGAPARVRRR